MDEMRKDEEMNDISQKIAKTIKKDWLIIAICLISIVACMVFYGQAQGSMDKVVDQCNEHYKSQIEKHCVCTFDSSNKGLELPSFLINSTEEIQ